MDLFSSQRPDISLPGTPLPEKMRPQRIEDVLGQKSVVKTLKSYIQQKTLPSIIFWGPPGVGKTTIAKILTRSLGFEFVHLNAVDAGVKDLKQVGESSRARRIERSEQTVVFVDEIHRFNKGQQDVLLPFVERGDFILVGATTENPSYELNRALLSRCRLFVLKALSHDELESLLKTSFDKIGLSVEQYLSDEAKAYLLQTADGDARKFLGMVEEVSLRGEPKAPLSVDELKEIIQTVAIGYDKSSDQHYDTISAFIKSIRGSDVDAALYYLARMLKGGEDPLFIARRLVILASEDIGNADPRALQVAMAGTQALEFIGLPEGAINLAHMVCYLASSPKSNRSYMAWQKAQSFVEKTGTQPIPLHLRSANTPEMKALGYKQGYLYPHDYPKNWVEQNYWPEEITPQKFYEPGPVGFEKQILEFQKWLK